MGPMCISSSYDLYQIHINNHRLNTSMHVNRVLTVKKKKVRKLNTATAEIHTAFK